MQFGAIDPAVVDVCPVFVQATVSHMQDGTGNKRKRREKVGEHFILETVILNDPTQEKVFIELKSCLRVDNMYIKYLLTLVMKIRITIYNILG